MNRKLYFWFNFIDDLRYEEAKKIRTRIEELFLPLEEEKTLLKEELDKNNAYFDKEEDKYCFYDIVDHNGNYVCECPMAYPSENNFRPLDKVVRVFGKKIVISYYHNGGPCSVVEEYD